MNSSFTWRGGGMCVSHFKMGNKAFETWFSLIKRCWGNGCGGMLWRGRHCGEGLLTISMEVCVWGGGGGFGWCSNRVQGPYGVCL